jgi:CBS-domain-containing membrane protein
MMSYAKCWKHLCQERFGSIPVVEKDGALVGIVEPHDLLRTETPDHHFTMRELARRDFVLAYLGEEP